MKFGPQFFSLLLVAAAAIILACGSSPHLQSLSVVPATASANDYPDGEVGFKAYAYYPGSSTPGAIQPTWSACPPINAVTVSKAGVAQCAPGAVGTYYVQAFVPVSSLDCFSSVSNQLQSCPENGPQCGGVWGVAKLTCP